MHIVLHIKTRTFFCYLAVINRWFLQVITVIYEISAFPSGFASEHKASFSLSVITKI